MTQYQRPGQRGYQGNRGAQQPQGRAAAVDATTYAREAQRIIVDGEVEALISLAEELAKNSGATRTSVRRLYGEARRIDFLLDQDRARALRRARLLEPRLVYQTKRAQREKQNLGEIASALIAMIRQLKHDDPHEEEQRFRRFVEFFEAVVAYLPEDKKDE